MIKKKDKKTLRQKALGYWDDYWDNFPYHIHETRYNSIFTKSPRTIPGSPKLKRNIFHPKEFSFISGCPKEWNKRYHIRPCRRQSKHMTEMSYIRYSRIQGTEDMAYEAEERFYPLYKNHVYYW